MHSLQSFIFRIMEKGLWLRINYTKSIPKLRAFSEKISRPLLLPYCVKLHRCAMKGIPVEWIMPSGPVPQSVILYLHGGAWVLVVDYRLAPEYPFPASLNDCLTAYHQLLNDGI